MATNNAILVFADAEGAVQHRFCPEAEARAYLAEVSERMDGGSMFACEDTEAEFILSVSPDLQNRVDDAKSKLRSGLRLKAAMDRHGVPLDRDLRIKIHRAFCDYLDYTI